MTVVLPTAALLRAIVAATFIFVHFFVPDPARAQQAGVDESAIPQRILEAAHGDSVAAHVFELADGRYFGRATGTAEMLAALSYVQEELERYGVRPGGRDGFMQPFTVDHNYIRAPARLLLVVDGDTTHFEIVEEFLPHQFSGSGSFDDRPLLLSDSSAIGTNFEGVAGSVVMYIPPVRYEGPGDLDPFERRQLPVVHTYEVAQMLSEAGAAAMLVPGSTYGRIGTKSVEELPIFDVTMPAVEKMVVGGFETVAQGVRRPGRDVRISGEAHATLGRNLPAANVVGLLPGADPFLRDEYVIVCAHVDHVGTIAGQIHYGAHDNASGTAVMLEVARLFQMAGREGLQPARSIVFIGFSGEEMALLGSRFYVEEDPIYPLESTSAVLNLDILGGGTGFMMVGGITWPGYFDLVSEINDEHFGHTLQKRDNAPNSDHFYFGHHGVPAGFFYGLEGPPVGIHTPTDTADKMDPAFMAEAARLAFATVWRLANLDPDSARLLRER